MRSQAEDVLFGDPVFGGDVLPADQSEPVPAAVGRVRPDGGPLNVAVSGWQIDDTPNPPVRGSCSLRTPPRAIGLTDGATRDIVLVFTLAGTTPPWPA